MRSLGPGEDHQHGGPERARALLCREALTNKHFLKTKVGPGTYESADFIQELARKPGSVRGVCASLDRRFREVKSCTPGPGSYGYGGVPGGASQSARGFLMRPRRFPEEAKDCVPGPGTYVLKSSIDVLLSKKTSVRGPYDLFSGPRDASVAAGSSAVPKHVAGAVPAERDPESLCAALSRPERRRHGVFSSLARYPPTPTQRIYCSTLAQWPRSPCLPGPGYYDVGFPRRPGNHKPPPFLSSAPRRSKQQERRLTACDSGVGPGSYNLDVKETERKYRSPTSAFKSSTPRFPPQPLRD